MGLFGGMGGAGAAVGPLYVILFSDQQARGNAMIDGILKYRRRDIRSSELRQPLPRDKNEKGAYEIRLSLGYGPCNRSWWP